MSSLQNANREYREMVNYLMDKTTCDDSCIFGPKCPVSSQGAMQKTCIIKRDAMYDTFYHLFFDTKSGIDEEIKLSLYEMAKESKITGDKRDYLSQLVKVKTALYGPDKTKDAKDITSVNVNITPVQSKDKSVTKSEKSNTKKKEKDNK